MNRIATCLLVCVGLSGCATAPGPITGSVQSAPANYRAQIIQYVKSNFKDPYSIRDASISSAPKQDYSPMPLPNGTWASGFWVVCFKANTKNSFGGYTGIRQYGAIFVDGEINSTISNPRFESFCNGTPYEPFPELSA